MTPLPKNDLTYWYREFRHLLSGWTVAQQIQFHQYCLNQLKDPKQRGTK